MILYTRNNCSACKNVKAYLDQEGYDYEEINIEEDADAAFRLVSHGARSVPTIEFGAELIVGAAAIKSSL